MDILTKGRSPVADGWFLMKSPAVLTLFFISYLLVVLRILPQYMATRKPFNLTNFTRLYNLAQVLACSYFFWWSFEFEVSLKDVWKCLPNETDEKKLIAYKSMQWWFLMLRLAELVETFVFILRKKQNQVSVLHLYHHISTPWIVWLFIKYCSSKLNIFF